MEIEENDENVPQEDLVFHYHREERLKNATPTVRDFYEGKGPTPPKGIFEALVHTKASRYSLFALILVLAFFVGFYFFGSKSFEDTLDGVEYKLSAFEFEDNVYVSIKVGSDETNKNKVAENNKVANNNEAAQDNETANNSEVSNKNETENDNETAKISVQICAIDNENQIVDKILFSQNDIKDSYFRTVFVNHDIIKIVAVIENEQTNNKIELSSKVSGAKQ